MNKIPTATRHYYTTTETGRQYIDRSLGVDLRPAAVSPSVDVDLLVYDRERNNVILEAQPLRTVVPTRLPTGISYFAYVQHLAKHYPRLYPSDGRIPVDHLLTLQRDRQRSTYTSCYCQPTKNADAAAGNVGNVPESQPSAAVPADWPTETTYQRSWRTPQQIRSIGGRIVRTRSCRMDEETHRRVEALKKQLREIYAIGRSEYTDRIGEVAELALDMGKFGTKRLVGYVDRYTRLKADE